MRHDAGIRHRRRRRHDVDRDRRRRQPPGGPRPGHQGRRAHVRHHGDVRPGVEPARGRVAHAGHRQHRGGGRPRPADARRYGGEPAPRRPEDELRARGGRPGRLVGRAVLLQAAGPRRGGLLPADLGAIPGPVHHDLSQPHEPPRPHPRGGVRGARQAPEYRGDEGQPPQPDGVPAAARHHPRQDRSLLQPDAALPLLHDGAPQAAGRTRSGRGRGPFSRPTTPWPTATTGRPRRSSPT